MGERGGQPFSGRNSLTGHKKLPTVPKVGMGILSHLYVARLRFFSTIVLGLNLLFFRYLSKIDAPAHLRLF